MIHIFLLLALLTQLVPGAPVALAALDPGGFIQVNGDQLTRLGQPVRIKGVNYYPQHRPWLEMWDVWDATQTAHEWRQARDEVGINVVRVLLPYSMSGKDSDEGRVDDRLIRQLRELCQIAGELDLRLIVTLFDFYNGFPEPGTREEEKNIAYLRTLIGNFVGDERIFAWDLHNEPDHYLAWTEGGAPRVLTWLGRMADEVHRLAPHHLVTVGMGQYDNLWQPGPDGRRVIDYSDVVSVHIYNPPDAVRQLDELRGYTSKPILLQEFGWPTGPSCAVRAYTEEQQRAVYEEMLAAAEGRVAGVVAWTLRDYDSGPTMRWDTREEHYGLYRADGSLKPAAELLRAYEAVPLPAVTQTSLELTNEEPRAPGGKNGPLRIDPSGHYIKAQFRRAWELLGGQGSFGLPISEAFVRVNDQRVVQYFEAAALELHPEVAEDPDFRYLSEIDQIKRLIQPIDLGNAASAGRSFAPPEGGGGRKFDTGYRVKGEFLSFYDSVDGRWRFGQPISNEITEDVGGETRTVQYFQRGRLEWNARAGIVEVGRLGVWAWDVQCQYAP